MKIDNNKLLMFLMLVWIIGAAFGLFCATYYVITGDETAKRSFFVCFSTMIVLTILIKKIPLV